MPVTLFPSLVQKSVLLGGKMTWFRNFFILIPAFTSQCVNYVTNPECLL